MWNIESNNGTIRKLLGTKDEVNSMGGPTK